MTSKDLLIVFLGILRAVNSGAEHPLAAGRDVLAAARTRHGRRLVLLELGLGGLISGPFHCRLGSR